MKKRRTIKKDELEKLITKTLEAEGYYNISSLLFSSDTLYFMSDSIHDEELVQQPEVKVAQVVGPKYSVDDTVRLKAKSEYGQSVIERFGHWWKIASHATKDKFYLRNLKQSEQGKFKGSLNRVEMIELLKQDDVNFEVIYVCPVGTKLNVKEHSL